MGKIKNIVVIGKNSYLASGLINYLPDHHVFSFTHTEWKENRDILGMADVVINFAIHPDFSHRILNEKEIIDLEIAENLSDKGHYIFLSSRRVYGKSNKCCVYTERSPVRPEDCYANNKLLCEKKLTQILDNRLTILRISNISIEILLFLKFCVWIKKLKL